MRSQNKATISMIKEQQTPIYKGVKNSKSRSTLQVKRHLTRINRSLASKFFNNSKKEELEINLSFKY